ncbi:MAG: LPS assembly lipoprotein LptE [Pseudomonadota bacterium]
MAGAAFGRRGALALLGSAGVVAACGFSPVYAPGSAGADLRGRVLPDAPGSRLAFAFVARFEDRLGRAEEGDLRLTYQLQFREERLALSGSGSDLRLAIVGRATFQVRDPGQGVLTQGQVEGSASFSDRGTSVAVRTARADAQRRAAVLLADKTADRLIATAEAWLP